MATTETKATIPAAGTYTIDPSHSAVSFTVRHLMVSKVRGRIPVSEGRLLVADEPTSSTVEATIDVSAIDTGDPKRDEHLRSADFFETDRYATAKFVSTKVEDLGDGEFVLSGDLTIRDRTHPVSLRGEYLGGGQSPWGASVIGFSAETEINRKDWGLEWNVALETGGVLVADKIKLAIDAEWIKQ